MFLNLKKLARKKNSKRTAEPGTKINSVSRKTWRKVVRDNLGLMCLIQKTNMAPGFQTPKFQVS